MFFEHWGAPEACRFLLAAALVFYLHVLFWFWKAQRLDLIQAIGAPSERRHLSFWIISVLVGAGYLGGLALTIEHRLTSYMQHFKPGVDNPWWFPASLIGVTLVGGGLCAVLLSFVWRAQHQGEDASITSALTQRLLAARSGRKQVARFTASWVAMLLMILAMMRPQQPTQSQIQTRGVDVVFALDVSASMLAKDIPENRLSAAKEEIKAMLESFKGHRVGLVVFTSVVHPQSPLTIDYGTIGSFVDHIQPHMMPVGGTSVGGAIDESRYLLTGVNPRRQKLVTGPDEPEVAPDEVQRAKTQIIIVMTDGEDHETDPRTAAERASKENIQIYTVGFGTAGSVPVPGFDEEGHERGPMLDQGDRGNPVFSEFQEKPLRDVARLSGGDYLGYRGPGSVAAPLVQKIKALEQSEMESRNIERNEDRFLFLLIPAALLLALLSLLGDRRRGARALQSALIVLIAGSSFVAGGCDTGDLFSEPSESVEAGNALLAKEKYSQALNEYRRTHPSKENRPLLDLNFGVAHYLRSGVAKPEEVKESLEQSIDYLYKAQSLPLADAAHHFMIEYDLGNAYVAMARQYENEEGGEKKAQGYYSKALDRFKRALELDPTSEDARHNLEVVLARLYPPCRSFEDDLEENDDLTMAKDNATTLDGGLDDVVKRLVSAEKLTVCGGDDDFYALPVGEGWRIYIEATFRKLPERRGLAIMDDSAKIEFARIELALVNSRNEVVKLINEKGEELEAEDTGPTLDERFEPGKAVRSLSWTRRILPASTIVAGEGEGPFFIRVRALDNAEARYAFKMKLRPPCREDGFEANNTREEATLLTKQNALPKGGNPPLPPTGEHYMLTTCPQDEDWFTIETSPGDALFIDVAAVPSKDKEEASPKLEMALFVDDEKKAFKEAKPDPNGLSLQEGLLNIEVFDLEHVMKTAHSFKLRVRGVDGKQEGAYSLTVYQYGPCGEGDDPLEENDTPPNRADLNSDQIFIRYLRICSQDDDYFLAKAKKSKEDSGGPGLQGLGGSGGPTMTNTLGALGDPVGFNATIEYDPRFGGLDLEGQDPVTSALFPNGLGQVAKSQAPKKQLKSISFAGAIPGQQFQLKVYGDQNFYHLYVLNNDEQSKANNKDQKDPPKDPPPSDKPPPKDSPPEDGDGDQGSPQSPSDDPDKQSDSGDQGTGDNKPQDPTQKPADPQEKGDPNPSQQGQPDPNERRQALTDERLDEIERNDTGRLHELRKQVEMSDRPPPKNPW